MNLYEAGGAKNYLWDLRFLDNPKTYLSQVLTYISKPRSTDKGTIKITYNEKGEIVKKETGISQFNRNTDKYIFTAQNQTFENKSIGNLSITYVSEGMNSYDGVGIITGTVINTAFTFKYTKSDEVLTVIKGDKSYLSVKHVSDKEIEKWLELLDKSPLSLLCHAPEISLYNNNSDVIMKLWRNMQTDEETEAYYFNRNTPITLKVTTTTNDITVKLIADNKNVLDRKNFKAFFTGANSYDQLQNIGLLTKTDFDLLDTFLTYCKTNKAKENDE